MFFEWLFFVTKPSFMTSLNLQDKLSLLWVTPLYFVSAWLLILLALRALERSRRLGRDEVAYWHFSAVQAQSSYVGYWGINGPSADIA